MYYVKSNLNHNGKAYIKGDQVELDTAAARALLADGVITSKLVLSDAEEAADEVIEDGTDEAEVDADEVIEDEIEDEDVPSAPAVSAYVVTEEDMVNNPTLAEAGLEVGAEVWLTPEAVAQVATPGYLASILNKDENESAGDNL